MTASVRRLRPNPRRTLGPTPGLRAMALASAFALLGAASARADDEPKYDFGKAEEVKTVIWKASANAGFLLTSGNSSTVSVSGGLNISRNDGKNKLTLSGGGAYAQSQLRAPSDLPAAQGGNANGLIDTPTEANNRVSQTTSQNWLLRLRYDRFFTTRNSGYIDVYGGQDVVAGKSLMAGGQVGYSRLLLHSEMNELAAEVGYDFSFNQYVDPATPSVKIHSARIFVGYVLTLSKDTALGATLEGLFNGNPIDVGPAGDPNTHFGPFEAYRIRGNAYLSTRLYKNISLRLAFTARYDNAPAPLNVKGVDLSKPLMLNGANVGVARNEKLDTMTEAAIVVTFL